VVAAATIGLTLATLLPSAAQAQSRGQPVNVQQAPGTSVAAIQSAVDLKIHFGDRIPDNAI
jgi:hypothetical protein